MTYFLIAGCGFVAAVLLSLAVRSREMRGILFVVFLALTCVAIALIPSENQVAKKKASIDDAVALLHAGQYAEARNAFRAINEKKLNCDAVLGIAECSYYLKDDVDCINQCMILCRNNQHLGRAYLFCGLVYKRAGDIDRAEKDFETAVMHGDRVATAQLESLEDLP